MDINQEHRQVVEEVACPYTGVYVCGMSRSGTTLLATILDSHPDVAMGYEMLPTGLEDIDAAAEALREAIHACGENVGACRRHLDEQGNKGLSKFVRQCQRTELVPSNVLSVLESNREGRDIDIDSIEMRSRLSSDAVAMKAKARGCSHGGFKINAPSLDAFDKVLPKGTFVFITRDPRDVMASHVSANFGRTPEHVGKAWTSYLSQFLAFQERVPDRAHLVRYEDLVLDPRIELERLFERIDLPLTDETMRFFESNASVHGAGHRNNEQIGKDFFTTSLSRWTSELSRDTVNVIQDSCEKLMPTVGYTPHRFRPSQKTPALTAKANGARIALSKKFYRDEYERLVLPLSEGRTNLTWLEAGTEARDVDKEILVLRHDVDHDIDTAVRMAKWEQSHGLRATYCILHTAWYYGSGHGKSITRFNKMIDQCREIESMGHEINLHNNFVVEALKNGGSPRDLMEAELYFLRSEGLKVNGSSTHGDRICKPLDFRNFEFFRECVYESRGGRRMVEHEGRSVEIGAVPMAELGLLYETYEMPRDFYVTDSGGKLRCQNDTRGRGGKRRAKMERPPAYPHITAILTHSIWWDFTRDSPKSRDVRDLVANSELMPV